MARLAPTYEVWGGLGRDARSIGLAMIVGVAAASAFAILAVATEAHHPKLTMADAQARASDLVAGQVRKAKYGREKGRWVYSFAIRPDAATPSAVRDLRIDADTGALVALETRYDDSRCP